MYHKYRRAVLALASARKVARGATAAATTNTISAATIDINGTVVFDDQVRIARRAPNEYARRARRLEPLEIGLIFRSRLILIRLRVFRRCSFFLI